MNWRGLGAKIVGSGLLLILFTIILFISIVWFQTGELKKQITSRIEQNEIKNLTSLTLSLYQRTQAQFDIIADKMNGDLNVARKILEGQGGFALAPSNKISWKAVNQYTKNAQNLDLPQVTIGGKPAPVTTSLNDELPVVDQVKEIVGATCTIFQRMNEAGDMLRVLTNVPNKQGKRAIGTFIPRRNPDGKENPVISTVLKGKTYSGRAFVVDRWYLTAYEPIKDGAGRIIGILYVGVELEKELAGLKKDISGYTLGQTGYCFVLDGRGRYIISKGNKRNGEDLWDVTNSEGRYPIREMVETAIKAPDGEVSLVKYAWRDAPDAVPRNKLAGVVYFKPLDWIIGASAYDVELKAATEWIGESVRKMLIWSAWATAAILLLGGLGLFIFSRRISRPILLLSELSKMFADGEVKLDAQELESIERIRRRRDELGTIGLAFEKLFKYLQHKSDEAESIAEGRLDLEVELASERDGLGRAFKEMTRRLNTALAEIKQTAGRTASNSLEIMQSNQALSNGASEQASSIEEITGAMNQLADNTRRNTGTASEAKGLMAEARRAAKDGTGKMAHLVETTSEINKSSKEIAKIIKTIDDIAFQTNLLALNAAVEAARAGMHGKGFAVVAGEVRNLAGRSAQAARETTELIETSLKSIGEETEAVQQTAAILDDIVTNVNKVGALVEEMHQANQDQSGGISQINEGLKQIESVTQRNLAGAEQTAAATQELSGQAELVEKLLTRFTVKNGTE